MKDSIKRFKDKAADPNVAFPLGFGCGLLLAALILAATVAILFGLFYLAAVDIKPEYGQLIINIFTKKPSLLWRIVLCVDFFSLWGITSFSLIKRFLHPGRY